MAAAAAGHLLLSPGNCEQAKYIALRESPTSVWDLDFLDERKCPPSPLFTLPKVKPVKRHKSDIATPGLLRFR